MQLSFNQEIRRRKHHGPDVGLSVHVVTVNATLNPIVFVVIEQQIAYRKKECASAMFDGKLQVACVVGPPIVTDKWCLVVA